MNEVNHIISEVLLKRHENKPHCPFFTILNGTCALKFRKFKPTVIYPGNTKGGKGLRVQVVEKYHGSMDCDFLHSNSEVSYFDCVLIQDFKPNLCITNKTLHEAIVHISSEVHKKYGVKPKHVEVSEVVKTIKAIRPTISKEMTAEIERWLNLHFEVFKNGEKTYLRLEYGKQQ